MGECLLKCKMDASTGKWRSLREGIQLGRIQRKSLEGDVQIALNWDARNSRDETQTHIHRTHREPLISQ